VGYVKDAQDERRATIRVTIHGAAGGGGGAGPNGGHGGDGGSGWVIGDIGLAPNAEDSDE
jgi:hypothetical protein